MPRAFLISTGNELLSGSTRDTNSDFLTRELTDMGFDIFGRTIVADSHGALEHAFRMGSELCDLIISTGGLGPTFDDLSRDAAARIAGVELELRQEIADELAGFFKKLGRDMPESNLRQAMFPSGSVALINRAGTARGIFMPYEDKLMVLLPGPPREMETMFAREVKPRLFDHFADRLSPVYRRIVRMFGLGESLVEERLQDLLQPSEGVDKAILAQNTEVCIKLATHDVQKHHEIDNLVVMIKERMRGYAYSENEQDSQAALLIERLKAGNHRVAIAESCTGGMISQMITDIPGSSDVYWGSVVSYDNNAKIVLLGVKESTLAIHGAVSEECALEMARGARVISGVDWSVATTGIAGPGGGSLQKPVGLVYIACCGPDCEKVLKLQIPGDRNRVRNFAARSGLKLLLDQINVGDQCAEAAK